MKTRLIVLALLLAGSATLAGCGLFGPSAPRLPQLPEFGGEVRPDDTGGLAVLTYIMAVSFGLAALSLVAGIFLKMPMVLRLAASLAGCGLASMVLRILVAKFMWVLVLLIAIGGIVTLGLYMFGHRKLIERRLNVDLDHDGKIGNGVTPTPTP